MALAVRERPPLRLHLTATTPDGSRFRWGEDSHDPANVPNGLQFSSIAPGGFDHLGCTLPRKSGIDYSDLERLTNIRVQGPGADLAWEGRLERAPRTSGDQFSVSPDCSGYQAALQDRSDIRAVYVERDLSRWQEASRQRKINQFSAGYDRVETGGSEPDATTGLPGLKQTIQGAQSDTAFTVNETWLDGIDAISDVYYDYVISNGSAASLNYRLFSADDDVATGFNSTADLYGSATGSGYFSPSPGQRWVGIWLSNTATWTDETERTAQTRRLAIFGDNGLTKRGAAPDQGFWASDVIAHAITKWCPELKVGTMQDSGFVILNMAFTDPTTVAEIVTQAGRFDLYDWAVWDDRTFHRYPRGAMGRSWRARIAPAQLTETGPQIDRLYNAVLVTYANPDGTQRSVGFPGSNADVTDPVLLDPDPENPANQLGIVRTPPQPLSMGTASLAEATEVGRRFLIEQKLLDTSGQAQLVGHVQDDRGVWHPAWRVRAGDTISFVDASDKSARRIVKADYDHSSRTCSIDLDSPPDGLAELFERLGVRPQLLGLS